MRLDTYKSSNICVAIAFASSLHTLCYGIHFNIDVVACVRSILCFVSHTMGDLLPAWMSFIKSQEWLAMWGAKTSGTRAISHPGLGLWGHDTPGIFDPRELLWSYFYCGAWGILKAYYSTFGGSAPPCLKVGVRAPSPPPSFSLPMIVSDSNDDIQEPCTN